MPCSLRGWDAPARSGSAPVKRPGWPRPSPGSGTAPAGGPQCGTPGRPLAAGARAPPRTGGRGKGGAALHVAVRGAVHVGSPRGPPLGCVCRPPRASGTRRPTGRLRPPPSPHGPPRASSPGLRAAASRALRPRLGLARLCSVRFGSPREEPPGLRLARGGASGSVLIGQGPGVERACPPQPRPRAPGPAET